MKEYVTRQLAKLNAEMAEVAKWPDAANRDRILSRLAGRMHRLNNLAWNAGR